MAEDTFIIDKNIQYIAEFLKNPENFKKLNLKNTGSFRFQKNRVIEGIQKLCYLWNHSKKTRVITLKILRSFFPFDSEAKVLEFAPTDKNIDVLLNNPSFDNPKGWRLGKFVKLAGLNEIQENVDKFKKVLNQSKTLEAKQRQNQDFQSYKVREDKIRNWVESLPYEIQHADFGYYNNNHKFYACRESIFAMRKFIEFCLEFDNIEIRNLCINKQRKLRENENKTIGANITNGNTILQAYSNMGTIG